MNIAGALSISDVGFVVLFVFRTEIEGARWGHWVESAVGVHLLATARQDGVDVLYWNVGAKEVDYVLRKGERLAAIEVKGVDATSISDNSDCADTARYGALRQWQSAFVSQTAGCNL